MASSITRVDIEKFDGNNDFGLWQIKMRSLMVQHGCDAALETLPADMEAGEKAVLMKKSYNTLILCLGDRVLWEVSKETTVTGIWTKLTSLYMIKSLVNRLYLKKKLYTESLKIEDVLATLNSKELKKRTKGTKEETGDGIYVRGRSDRSSKAHSGGSSRFMSRGRTSKLKCFICHSEGHLKRDCPMKKSSGFVKKGMRDQDSDSSDDEGNAYFGEALVVFRNDEITELVMDSCGSYDMTHRKDFLYEFKGFDGGSVQLGDNRTCTINGTGKGYTMKMQMGRIKVIKGCRVMMTGIMKNNCVYTLEAKVMAFGVQKHEGLRKKYRLNLKNDMPPRDKKHFKTLSLDESRSPDFDLFSNQEEYSEEEVAEIMAKTMEQYMSKTRAVYGSGVARPKIEDKDNFKLKGQFLKELRTNTFSGSDHEDANEHIEKVLEIVTRSTETSDGLAAIQAQLNNLGREIKKMNEKIYAAQVGCEQCKGPHYTKDCPLKEEGKTLEEAYYAQFGAPFQGGGYRATAPRFYQMNNANPSYQERRQSMEETDAVVIGLLQEVLQLSRQST
ncbi:zinc finger, CCHC-type containing protein [Tanacetum coccineum]